MFVVEEAVEVLVLDAEVVVTGFVVVEELLVLPL